MNITVSQKQFECRLDTIWRVYIGTETNEHPYSRLHSIEQATVFFMAYALMYGDTDAGTFCYWLHESAMAIRENLIKQMAEQQLHYPARQSIVTH